MTARTPTYLKARFEQGDIPQGTDYEDVFDSYVNVATSAEQSMAGSLRISGQLSATSVSAATLSGVYSGNAATATALQNARTIGGVSFDGTANISVLTATGGFTISGGDLVLGANNITITGSIGATGARSTKGWFTDLQVTNAISGSITGNSATVTTNANLTGPITSTGNATAVANNAITDAMLAQMPANTIKLNNTGSTANAINGTIAQAQGMIAANAYVYGPYTIDFNSANTDTSVTIALPTGITRYRMNSLLIAGASAAINSATIGLFSAAAGAGTALVANSAVTVTTASENSANNAQTLSSSVAATNSLTHTTLYIRIGTAQGSAATASVSFNIILYPS